MNMAYDSQDKKCGITRLVAVVVVTSAVLEKVEGLGCDVDDVEDEGC